jgi:hypothetical protein
MENNEMGWACRTYGKGRDVYRELVGKPEGKRPLADRVVDGRIILRRIFGK